MRVPFLFHDQFSWVVWDSGVAEMTCFEMSEEDDKEERGVRMRGWGDETLLFLLLMHITRWLGAFILFSYSITVNVLEMDAGVWFKQVCEEKRDLREEWHCRKPRTFWKPAPDLSSCQAAVWVFKWHYSVIAPISFQSLPPEVINYQLRTSCYSTPP